MNKSPVKFEPSTSPTNEREAFEAFIVRVLHRVAKCQKCQGPVQQVSVEGNYKTSIATYTATFKCHGAEDKIKFNQMAFLLLQNVVEVPVFKQGVSDASYKPAS